MPVHSHDNEAPKYLGLREGSVKAYDNVRESDYEFWESEYGYKRGEPIEELNRKIREKCEREKEEYFKRF